MCPLKATTANQESWGAEWCRPQNVSWCCISYCSLSLFYTLVCMIMLKALCIFELCFLSIVISYRISCDWEEIIKAIKALWLFVERVEAHYWETAWTLASHAIYLGSHEAHYPFGETTGQGTTTCPLQSSQQQGLQNSEVTWDSTFQSFAVILFAIQSASQEETRRMRWEKATAASHYELGWLMVIMQSV